MAKKYLTCAETAKLVRAALKEAFPGVKFSVKSSTYSGGASISVGWQDGPNTEQVDSVVNVFKGSYFDGTIDYQGSIYHMIDGQQVSMGADYIHTNREHSDKAIQSAIRRVMARFGAAFAEIEAPTVEDYRAGRLWRVQLGNVDVQSEINSALYRHTFQPRTIPSKTAGKVVVLGDDGYSMQCGRGFSAVVVDDVHIGQ